MSQNYESHHSIYSQNTYLLLGIKGTAFVVENVGESSGWACALTPKYAQEGLRSFRVSP
jgi:hypothetical protein